MRYFTINIYLVDNKTEIQLIDIDQVALNVFRREVWTSGIYQQLSPICRQLHSPYVIKKILIINQDKKINP